MKKSVKYQIAGWVLIILIIIVLVVIGGWIVLTEMGRSSLHRNATSKMPVILDITEEENTENAEETPTEELVADDTWQEDWIRYKGGIYDYNEDILTFLCMGVDVNGEVTNQQSGMNSGQADAIFLLVLNPDTKQIHIIAIDRNTMTDIDSYDNNGDYTGTFKAQVALAHGYGDGKQKSAENTLKAVSNIMYELPIHGYCAVNMSAIADINDAVGGVDVTVLEDLTSVSSKLTEGSQVHLKGKDAYYYVKYRDITIEESARKRLNRQKQYLVAYVNQAKSAFKEDIMLPFNLFNHVSKYMTTDMTVDEVVYLAGSVADYEFSEENLIMIPGQTNTSGRFDEFYPDEAQLKQIIVDIFYSRVDEVE